MRAFAVSALPLLCLAMPAGAQDQNAATSSAVQRDAALDEISEPDSSPFAVPAIGESELQAVAGREDTTQIAQADQFAGVTENSVGDNSVTGDARISDNAFQNMSGLSILNVNTGNNVAINASMNVNVSISPAP